MECNKDEAIRAKELAQTKMQNSDFVGARKIAIKAQQLFPDLENITQLLAVCNVHCSAQSRILGSEKDWYSILQLERKADEVAIKKQYRKLALVLHPDKNQFPGAEAAFKLIGEANLVLSDRSKKAVYDSKVASLYKSAEAKNPRNQVNQFPPTGKQNWCNKSMPNAYFAQFSVPNNLKRAQVDTTNIQQAYCTRCSYCNQNFMYHRNYVGMKVTCQICKRDFIAIDVGLPVETNYTQATSQGIPVPTRSMYQSQAASQGVPSRFNKQPQASNHGIPRRFNNQGHDASQGMPAKPKGSQPAGFWEKCKTTEKTTGFQPLKTGYSANIGGTSTVGGGTDGVAAPNVNHGRPIENHGKRRKRKRQIDIEISESSDSSSSSNLQETSMEEVESDVAAAQNTGVNGFQERRRSSRRKHDVSYTENEGDDDDFESPPKRSQDSKSFSGSEEGKKNPDPVKEGNLVSDRPEFDATSGETKMSGKLSEEEDGGAQGVDVISDSESESFSEDDDGPQTYQCPDAEFNDFDKDREESCFRVGQFWACYDTEGMPRYYAKVKEVCSNPFKLGITWLEPKPDDAFAKKWHKKKLPIACGKYRWGELSSQDCFAFSHQIDCEIGSRKGSLMVYPRRGEIWALFRNWNTGWVNNRRSPKNYAYDFVEVLSEFTEDAGIQVLFLEKLKGFVSLVCHNQSNSTPISIPPSEILKFSHRVPSFRMKGNEKKGVPAGSFELDTASLPLEQVADAKNPNASIMPETVATPKRSDEHSSKTCSGGETSVLRKSPRGLSTGQKKN